MKSKVEIYRVVDKYRDGYKSSLDSIFSSWTDLGTLNLSTFLNVDYQTIRPMPENDGISPLEISDKHFFAFLNKEDLCSWFTPAEMKLGSLLGAMIEVYEVEWDSLLIGGKQVAFIKEDSKLIDEFSMDLFLNQKQRDYSYDFVECFNDCLSSEMLAIPDDIKEFVSNGGFDRLSKAKV